MSPSTHGIPAPDPMYTEDSLGRKFEQILADYPMLPLAGVLTPVLVRALMETTVAHFGTALEYGVAWETVIAHPTTGARYFATEFRPVGGLHDAQRYIDGRPFGDDEVNPRIVYRLVNTWYDNDTDTPSVVSRPI